MDELIDIPNINILNLLMCLV